MNDKVMNRVVKTRGCWGWLGGRGEDGYGHFYVGRDERGKNVYRMAHRVVYEMLVGPIPEGCDLHHTCHNKGCVNPKHLKPMTDSEHRQTHYDEDPMCAKGLHPKVPGSKRCRECRRAAWKRNNDKRPARTKGPVEVCECGKEVAWGYLTRHQRAHGAVR